VRDAGIFPAPRTARFPFFVAPKWAQGGTDVINLETETLSTLSEAARTVRW
jgi:hypothetical protein